MSSASVCASDRAQRRHKRTKRSRNRASRTGDLALVRPAVSVGLMDMWFCRSSHVGIKLSGEARSSTPRPLPPCLAIGRGQASTGLIGISFLFMELRRPPPADARACIDLQVPVTGPAGRPAKQHRGACRGRVDEGLGRQFEHGLCCRNGPADAWSTRVHPTSRPSAATAARPQGKGVAIRQTRYGGSQ